VLINIGPFSFSTLPTPSIFPFLQLHLQVFYIGVIFQALCSITNFLQDMYTKLQKIITILSLYVLTFYYHYIIAQKNPNWKLCFACNFQSSWQNLCCNERWTLAFLQSKLTCGHLNMRSRASRMATKCC
jgi:hypothetical protein